MGIFTKVEGKRIQKIVDCYEKDLEWLEPLFKAADSNTKKLDLGGGKYEFIANVTEQKWTEILSAIDFHLANFIDLINT